MSSELRSIQSDLAKLSMDYDLSIVFDIMASAAIRMCEGNSYMRDETSIRRCMNIFLRRIEIDDVELNIKHLDLFNSVSTISSISKLYMSSVKKNKELGWHVINEFISAIDRFPELLRPYAAPSVLQFCIHLETIWPRDVLFFDSRSKLCSLVDIIFSMESAPVVRSLVAWHEIFPFVIEQGHHLVWELRNSFYSPSMVTRPKLKYVSDFKTLLSVVLNHILEAANLEDPVGMPDGAVGLPFCEQLKDLHWLFSELLNMTDLYLRRAALYLFTKDGTESIFNDQALEYLFILRALNDISKIYKGAPENFKKMLEMRRITLRALLMIYAETHELVIEYVDWLTEHKETLGFRWILAMMIPSRFDKDDEYYEMLIDRSNLFAESFGYITQADTESLYAGLSIQFINEEATGPGVRREWFLLVCKEIFSTQNGLFISNPNDHKRFYINPASKVEPKHLDYFEFCGRVVALALMYEVQVGIVFDRVLFMQLAGLDIQLENIKDTDPTLYHSCKKILDMDADLVDSDILGLTFTTEYEEFGSRTVVELHPGGGSLKVDSRNRLDYVNSLIRSRFCDSICSQVAHFSIGFEDILSSTGPEYMSLFFRCLKLEDLDQMLRGSESDLLVEDWKSHTVCKGYTDEDPQIIWFWKIVEELDPEQQRHLLFFWTAVKYLSFDGFLGLSSRLEIHKASTTIDHLPTSHTCFNQICLPEYPTYEMMQQRVAIIIQEHVGAVLAMFKLVSYYIR